ncbi:SDR family NAD(P)-dependent oxidoreductase [Bacillus velezensis]|uniref:type I polyketide synthase n=1 Tax=Bacillus velezensis TaxID=492670 RepID=UPI0011EB38CF|nr:type I polyketide synthase [Bacillus velezensis]QGH56385.1 SDR family NAD(P)-dependent oxidoreductase [Bacillus velezensis]
MKEARHIRKKVLSDIESGIISLEEGVKRIQQLGSHSAGGNGQAIYYQTVWQRTDLSIHVKGGRREGSLLLFDKNEDVSKELAALHDTRVILVKPGKEFRKTGDGVFEIDPRSERDYINLLGWLIEEEKSDIREAVHLWSDMPFEKTERAIREQCDSGVYSLFLLQQALFKNNCRKPIKLLYGYFSHLSGEQPLYAAASGFLRTLQLENPLISAKSIEMEQSIAAVHAADIIRNELSDFQPSDVEIRYKDMQRYVKQLKTYEPEKNSRSGDVPLRENGVYIIAGGAGGLGFTFAEYLAFQTKCCLVLTGRSPLSDHIRKQLRRLEDAGSSAVYVQADITNKEEAEYVVKTAKTSYGKVNGVIQGAGIIRDSFLLNKSREEFDQVIRPKVLGTMWLNDAVEKENPDFFICFSSTSAVLGNVGQSDYAFGNSYMDHFMNMRSARNSDTISLSLNWPLWKEVGMQVDERTVETMKKAGFYPLEKEEGKEAFAVALSSGFSQFTVFYGDEQIDNHVQQLYERKDNIQADEGTGRNIESFDSEKLKAETSDFIIKVIAAEFRMPADKIDAEEALEKYGLDSVMIINMTNELEKHFGALSKTLLFEYQTAEELSQYFVEEHRDTLLHKLRLGENGSSTPSQKKKDHEQTAEVNGKQKIQMKNQVQQEKYHDNDIAIIGISGRYPMANDLDTLWENLLNGKDCITEIPEDRWDSGLHYQPAAGDEVKNQSKWGGFIDDVYHFDPLFFNISPAEAELIDPQERLFLETVWHTIEDAGYAKKTLERKNVGVFAGVMYGHYQLYSVGHEAAVSSSYASIANRVSYFFNFSGPSIALDTMCSSSLTAVHFACESLIRNECEIAIAGGVNLSIHPHKYELLTQGGFLSSDGRCRSFGSGGDGYVPGEGTGAVLLKPVKKAIADGDQIYSVIKATAINHGAKTNGYTVPNPKAQSEVITRALKKGFIDPKSISYIEAHGTGTALGDPIEITGLTRAFSDAERDKKTCAIGSIKSNIGHLEAAAGIAGITKVILQMKHKTIVPSLTHSAELNENIPFQKTPFYVPDSAEKWESSVPRRAGISSFGAGGANAHVILEEFADEAISPLAAEEPEQLLFVFSAKNADRLAEYAKRAKEHIAARDYPLETLRNTAFTLQTGREEMPHRLAVIASTRDELLKGLTDYTLGNATDHIFTSGKDTTEAQRMNKAEIEEAAANRDLLKIAEYWVGGNGVDWPSLYKDATLRRVSAPGYPFAKELCRIDAQNMGSRRMNVNNDLHPYISCNISDFKAQKFLINVSDTGLYIKTKYQDKEMFPFLSQIEMARAAGAMASGNPIIKLTELSFREPMLQSGSNEQIRIVLTPDNQGASYSIEKQSDSSIYSSGRLELEGGAYENGNIHLEPFLSQRADPIPYEAFYQRLAEFGYSCSDSLKAAEHCVSRNGQVLLKIKAKAGPKGCIIKPEVIESVYQAVIYLAGENAGELPENIKECTIFDHETEPVYVYAEQTGESDSAYDVYVLDNAGGILMELSGLVFGEKPYQNVRFYEHKWDQKNPLIEIKDREPKTILVFAKDEALAGALKNQSDSRVILVTPDQRQTDQNLLTFCVNPEVTSDYIRLFEELEKKGFSPDVILHTGETFYAGDHLLSGLESIFYLLKALSARSDASLYLHSLLLVHSFKEGVNDPYTGALAGCLKTANMLVPSAENVKSIGFSERISIEKMAEFCLNEMVSRVERQAEEVKYINDKRYVKTLKDYVFNHTEHSHQLKQEGIYLITGGLGGLGLIFAKYLASQYQAKLVLTGRSPLTADKRHNIDRLQALGGDAVYYQADAADQKTMGRVIEETKRTWGSIQGVIHSAGHADDRLFTEMNLADFSDGMTAKIEGTVCLDELTKDEPLDFFIVFSSISSVFGDFGQVNYALCNYFQDQYINWRSEQSRRQERQGKSISINWPLWRKGGMHLNKEAEEAYLSASGFDYLETEEGIAAFETILASDCPQISVVTGDAETTPARKDLPHQKVNTLPVRQEEISYTAPAYTDNVLEELKQMVSELLKINIEQLDTAENFGNLGFDSISLKTLAVRLNKKYKLKLTPAVFFTYSHIKSLSEFLNSELRTVAKGNTDAEKNISEKRKVVHAGKTTGKTVKPPRSFPFEKKTTRQADHHPEKQPVAIIGMSCVFPGAKNADEFWINLINEKDLIQEIPPDRWDWKKYAEGKGSSEVHSKWGGFITDADKFDEAFFNINPREAELMDPQHRIYLQETWKAIEDAGYKASKLSGKNIGVFTGIQFNDYRQLLMRHSDGAHAFAGTGNSQALISNRVSHYFNFRGPSESIDTACSSSLVAIHRAVRSIQNGESELAVAGGVSLLLDPVTHMYTDKLGILSRDGRCKTFDKLADGYVRGEGAAVLLLKPLQAAMNDRDNIYGVLRGTGENHGGRSASLTAPNPEAQAELLTSVYKNADIPVDTISYIEAHGTGTELGDPIEIEGLKKAFGSFEPHSGKNHDQYCGIGSVKTNIGHLEPASGMPGLIKVLLSMKYKTLPATLHVNELNPYIQLSGTPFHIVNKTMKWARLIDRKGNEIPRRAGVSSFGFGGANAHVIVEEFEYGQDKAVTAEREQIIVLSAKTKERLMVKAKELTMFLHEELSVQFSQQEVQERDLQEAVREAAAGILRLDTADIDAKTPLSEFGFDPLAYSELISFINQMYGTEISLDIFQELKTLSELCRYISSIRNRSADKPYNGNFREKSGIGLEEIAYTLQTGREPFECRLAITCSNTGDLLEKLNGYIQGSRLQGVYEGNVTDFDSLYAPLFGGPEGHAYVQSLIQQNKPAKLAQLWTIGCEISWEDLYEEELKPVKLSLPLYPFSKNRHWIHLNKDEAQKAEALSNTELHNSNKDTADGEIMSLLEKAQTGEMNTKETSELIEELLFHE